MPHLRGKTFFTSNVKNVSHLQLDIFCYFDFCYCRRNAFRLTKHSQPFNMHPEKWFWGWHLKFFEVATLKKIRWVFFNLWHNYKPSFFQSGDPKKSGFAEHEIYLGFETNPDFSNQKSGCRLKGRVSICEFVSPDRNIENGCLEKTPLW